MNRKEVEAIELGKTTSTQVATGKPHRMEVDNLPTHLHVAIVGSQFGYQYSLRRDGDETEYKSRWLSSPDVAIAQLKSLLNWDPVGRV